MCHQQGDDSLTCELVKMMNPNMDFTTYKVHHRIMELSTKRILSSSHEEIIAVPLDNIETNNVFLSFTEGSSYEITGSFYHSAIVF